jgi:holo-[acyl-carrier protein] synthase
VVRGVGIDAVSESRMAEILARSGASFLRRSFTRGELRYLRGCANAARSCAMLFAGKEAVFKSIGEGWERGAALHDIEIKPRDDGTARVTLRGAFADIVREDDGPDVRLRVGFRAGLALAVAIREYGGRDALHRLVALVRNFLSI